MKYFSDSLYDALLKLTNPTSPTVFNGPAARRAAHPAHRLGSGGSNDSAHPRPAPYHLFLAERGTNPVLASASEIGETRGYSQRDASQM